MLDAALRVYRCLAEEQGTGVGVAPFSPAGEFREDVSALLKELLAVDAIEGVGKVDFDKNGAGVVAVLVTPLPCDV